MKLFVPLPNLNGNGHDELLDSHCECLTALRAAFDSLACGESFDARNYQTHPDAEAWREARAALDRRRSALRRIIAEVEAMAEAVADGEAFAVVPD